EERLSEENAEEIWHRCNERLQEKSLRAAGILEQFDVRVACTTDDPADSLAAHGQIANNGEITAKVLPTFRPDRALNITAPGFQEYMTELGQAAGCAVE